MEYSEEEKKAVEDFKKTIDYYNKRFRENERITSVLINNFDVDNIYILLNLIEKQQKEIERLTYGRNFLFDNICAQNWTPEMFNRLVEEKYIPKESIREKIKEIEDSLKDDCIALHEFQRLAKIDILKEIEDSLKDDCIALHEFQRLAKINILKELLGE